MSTKQTDIHTKVSRRNLLQVMGAGAVASLAPGAANASTTGLGESTLGGAPQSALRVSGVLANRLQEELSHAHVFVLKFGEDSQQWPTLRVNADDQAVQLRTSLGDVAFLTGTTPAERLRITQAGNIGIGIRNPTSKLHVAGSLNVTGLVDVNVNTMLGYRPGSTFTAQVAPFAAQGRRMGKNALGWFRSSQPGQPESQATLWLAANNGMTFFTQDAPRLTVTAGGNVGIGTSTPEAMLHLQVEDNEALRIENTSLAKSTRMGVDALGVWIEPEENDSSIRLNANPERIGLFVKGIDGNVGIGTTEPSQALHVVGDVQIEGTLRARSSEIADKKIAGGTTDPSDWVVYVENRSITVVVDTSAAGFTATPYYVASLTGDSNHWSTLGGSAIYDPTPTGFQIFVQWGTNTSAVLNPAYAVQHEWRIFWIGIEQ